MMIASTNPATGETVKTFEALGETGVTMRIERAAYAFASHRAMPVADRAEMMHRAGDILRSEKLEFARLITLEMGKPIAAAVAEVEKCELGCRFYADNAAAFLNGARASDDDGESRIVFQPIGVILAVMPWNFPFWQVFRFIAPAVMAGNTVLLKHSSNVPQCALAIESVIQWAGFPEGTFQTMLVASDAVERIIADPKVTAVTLTGSEAAGRSVAAIAGRNLKKTVLELGGSDPFIVMPSAELDVAVATAISARMVNNGQSCIAAKRFIVHEDVYDRFMERFVDGVRAIRVGDPMEESTELGPLATSDIRAELAQQVEKTIAMGASLLCGGASIDGPGFFYEPTVLADIPDGSPAAVEELFGPVASVWKATDIDDAVRLANSTSFGLGASAWTANDTERERFIQDLESGMVFINGMVASEPALPFGGVKNSGYGRELGEFGIREFVNVKAVRIAESSGLSSDTE